MTVLLSAAYICYNIDKCKLVGAVPARATLLVFVKKVSKAYHVRQMTFVVIGALRDNGDQNQHTIIIPSIYAI